MTWLRVTLGSICKSCGGQVAIQAFLFHLSSLPNCLNDMFLRILSSGSQFHLKLIWGTSCRICGLFTFSISRFFWRIMAENGQFFCPSSGSCWETLWLFLKKARKPLWLSPGKHQSGFFRKNKYNSPLGHSYYINVIIFLNGLWPDPEMIGPDSVGRIINNLLMAWIENFLWLLLLLHLRIVLEDIANLFKLPKSCNQPGIFQFRRNFTCSCSFNCYGMVYLFLAT